MYVFCVKCYSLSASESTLVRVKPSFKMNSNIIGIYIWSAFTHQALSAQDEQNIISHGMWYDGWLWRCRQPCIDQAARIVTTLSILQFSAMSFGRRLLLLLLLLSAWTLERWNYSCGMLPVPYKNNEKYRLQLSALVVPFPLLLSLQNSFFRFFFFLLCRWRTKGIKFHIGRLSTNISNTKRSVLLQ